MIFNIRGIKMFRYNSSSQYFVSLRQIVTGLTEIATTQICMIFTTSSLLSFVMHVQWI